MTVNRNTEDKRPVRTPEAVAPAHASLLFEIIRITSGWRVDKGGHVYATYRTQDQAIAGARKAAEASRKAGIETAISFGPVNRV